MSTTTETSRPPDEAIQYADLMERGYALIKAQGGDQCFGFMFGRKWLDEDGAEVLMACAAGCARLGALAEAIGDEDAIVRVLRNGLIAIWAGGDDHQALFARVDLRYMQTHGNVCIAEDNDRNHRGIMEISEDLRALAETPS